jgi:hypothetical protein
MCTQCGKRSVTCGGYKKEFRWPAFEEPSVPGKQATTPLVLKNIDPTYSMPQDYTDSTTQLELDDSQIHTDWTTPVDLNGSQIQLLGNVDPTYCMPLEYTNLTTPLALKFDGPTYRMPVDYTSWTTPLVPEFNDPHKQVPKNIDSTYDMEYKSWPPILETMEHRKETRATLTFPDIPAVSSPPQSGKLLQAFMLGHQGIHSLPQKSFDLPTTNDVAGWKADLLPKPLATPSSDERTKQPYKLFLGLGDDRELDQRHCREDYRIGYELRFSTSHYDPANGSIMWDDQAQQALPKDSDDGMKNRVKSLKRGIDELNPGYRIEDYKEDSDSRLVKRCKS